MFQVDAGDQVAIQQAFRDANLHKVLVQSIITDPPGILSLLDFGLEFPQHFCTGNILKDPKKPAELLQRDLFSKEDCTKASLVMRRLADPVAPMYIWTPEYLGDSKGNNEDKVDVAQNWREVLSGKCLFSMSHYETPCNNVSRKS